MCRLPTVAESRVQGLAWYKQREKERRTRSYCAKCHGGGFSSQDSQLAWPREVDPLALWARPQRVDNGGHGSGNRQPCPPLSTLALKAEERPFQPLFFLIQCSFEPTPSTSRNPRDHPRSRRSGWRPRWSWSRSRLVRRPRLPVRSPSAPRASRACSYRA